MGLLEKIINKQIQEEEKTFTKAELQSLLRRAEHILSGSDSDNTEADKKKKNRQF